MIEKCTFCVGGPLNGMVDKQGRLHLSIQIYEGVGNTLWRMQEILKCIGCTDIKSDASLIRVGELDSGEPVCCYSFKASGLLPMMDG